MDRVTTNTARQSRLFVRLAIYTWERRLSSIDVALLTAIYAAAVSLCVLLTNAMIFDRQISDTADTPIWDKIVTSYLGFLIYFMHLRALIDARDVGLDRVAHPQRPAARGLVSPGELLLLALLMLAVEGVLLANVGELRLLAWSIAVVFSFSLRFDFGLGRWMRARPLSRMVAHSLVYPVVFAMLAAVAWEATITFGLVPDIDLATGRRVPGLGLADLFLSQPLTLGLLYLGGFSLALARDMAGGLPARDVDAGASQTRANAMIAVGVASLLSVAAMLLPTATTIVVVAAAIASILAARLLRTQVLPVTIIAIGVWGAIAVAGQYELAWVSGGSRPDHSRYEGMCLNMSTAGSECAGTTSLGVRSIGPPAKAPSASADAERDTVSTARRAPPVTGSARPAPIVE